MVEKDTLCDSMQIIINSLRLLSVLGNVSYDNKKNIYLFDLLKVTSDYVSKFCDSVLKPTFVFLEAH